MMNHLDGKKGSQILCWEHVTGLGSFSDPHIFLDLVFDDPSVEGPPGGGFPRSCIVAPLSEWSDIAVLILCISAMSIMDFSDPFNPACLIMYFAYCEVPLYCLVTSLGAKSPIPDHVASALGLFRACRKGTKSHQNQAQIHQRTAKMKPEIVQINSFCGKWFFAMYSKKTKLQAPSARIPL